VDGLDSEEDISLRSGTSEDHKMTDLTQGRDRINDFQILDKKIEQVQISKLFGGNISKNDQEDKKTSLAARNIR